MLPWKYSILTIHSSQLISLTIKFPMQNNWLVKSECVVTTKTKSFSLIARTQMSNLHVNVNPIFFWFNHLFTSVIHTNKNLEFLLKFTNYTKIGRRKTKLTSINILWLLLLVCKYIKKKIDKKQFIGGHNAQSKKKV